MNEHPIICLITVPNEEKAKALGRNLVNEKLAACANTVPGLTSIYRWKGEVCEDREVLLILKTLQSKFDMIVRQVKLLHEYEVPEIISLPIEDGLEDYLNWIKESVQ